MIDNPVLITGFSGRALAQSALRAGYTPFVFDAYGDEDTRSVAHTCLTDPGIIGSGLRVKPTVAALETLLEAAGNRPDSAPQPPVLLTSGFESSPKLITALEQKFNVLSTPSKTVADVKAPDTFFTKLTELGIPHPKTLTTADPDARDPSVSWLSKRIGGMGGLHITRLSAETKLPPNYYAQEEISGLSISATAIAAPEHHAFAFTQSWINPTPETPFRYGGVVGSVSPDTDLETRLVDMMLTLLGAFDLRGLVSFDFMISDGEAFLLEINPRPTAALDVLDDAHGTLFKANLAAASGDGEQAMHHLQNEWQPTTKAAAYLYADAGSLTIPQVAWPAWAHDRPLKGATIPHRAPIMTVVVEGETPTDAVKQNHQRLEHMAYVVYDSEKKRRDKTDADGRN